jgi:hypothetical protein
MSIFNSIIEGGLGDPADFAANHNLDVDPLFVITPGDLNFLHLQNGSPAINKGDNLAIPEGITTDRDGNPRLVDFYVDMGAYENQTLSNPVYLPLVSR